MHHHSLEVDLRDLGAWNEELGQKVQEQPGEVVPLVSAGRRCDDQEGLADALQLESALTRLARSLLHPSVNEAEGSRAAAEAVPAMQVVLRSGMNLLSIPRPDSTCLYPYRSLHSLAVCERDSVC